MLCYSFYCYLNSVIMGLFENTIISPAYYFAASPTDNNSLWVSTTIRCSHEVFMAANVSELGTSRTAR